MLWVWCTAVKAHGNTAAVHNIQVYHVWEVVIQMRSAPHWSPAAEKPILKRTHVQEINLFPKFLLFWSSSVYYISRVLFCGCFNSPKKIYWPTYSKLRHTHMHTLSTQLFHYSITMTCVCVCVCVCRFVQSWWARKYWKNLCVQITSANVRGPGGSVTRPPIPVSPRPAPVLAVTWDKHGTKRQT